MPKDVTKVATLSAELASYSATFSALGLTLIGEQWSSGEYSVHAIRTTGGTLFGTPQHDISLKAAVNALIDAIALKPTTNKPIFP